MNKELLELVQKAQKAWLDGCLSAYGKMLDGAEQFIKMTREQHQKWEATLKAKKDAGSENK